MKLDKSTLNLKDKENGIRSKCKRKILIKKINKWEKLHNRRVCQICKRSQAFQKVTERLKPNHYRNSNKEANKRA